MKEYYDFVGETIDGDIIEESSSIPLTREEAKSYATRLLKQFGGGHIDVMYADTDSSIIEDNILFFSNAAFAFDVEV